MSSKKRHWPRIGFATCVRAAMVAMAAANLHCARAKMPGPPKAEMPTSNEPGGPAPHAILAKRTLHQPPPLAGSGAEGQRATLAFIEWAGASTVSEREDGRKVMVAARDNKDVVQTLQDEIMKAKDTDHSRALLCLAILGELRSPRAEPFLREFVSLPLPDPDKGPIAEGENVLVTALASLQAKAVDGLAYLGSRTANEFLLFTIAKNPSRIVRAEAINAFLWNAKDGRAARVLVLRSVQKGEEIFVDRVRMEDREKAATFNAKLKVFLKTHPEVIPPAPEKAKPRDRDSKEPPKEDVVPQRPNW